MSHSIPDNNSFQGLINAKSSSEKNTVELKKNDPIATEAEDKSQSKEDSSWTAVQSSNKTRRLVPQVSLTRQNLGTENNVRNKSNPEPGRKKGTIKSFIEQQLLNISVI